MKSELQTLLTRWQDLTGEPMPLAIQRLGIETIRKAVERTARGEHVFVPVAVERAAVDSGSMMVWDSPKRFEHFLQLGADSCDGSGVAMYDHMLEKIERRNEPKPSLFDECFVSG